MTNIAPIATSYIQHRRCCACACTLDEQCQPRTREDDGGATFAFFRLGRLTNSVLLFLFILLFANVFAWASDTKYDAAVDSLLDTSDKSSTIVSKWLKLYCGGKIKEADLEWISILKSQAGTQSIDRLLWSIEQESVFLDGADKKEFKCAPTALFEHLLSVTERSLGKDHRFICDICDDLAILANDRRNYSESKKYRLRELELSRKLGDLCRTAYVLNALGHLEVLTKDYSSANRDLEQSIALTRKAGCHRVFIWAARHYIELLRITHREADTAAFIAKSKTYIWPKDNEANAWFNPKEQ
jgi:hypothetical protein